MLQTDASLVDSLVVFVVSLLVGALGIYVGARVIAGVEDYTYAIVTALVGSVVYAVVAFLVPFGWLGLVLALVAYLAVINWRYPGDLGSAVGITLVAWLTVVVVMWLLALVGVVAPEATGIPFV
ncbi:hypothetical protein [Candidatus Halobonum tyrrellensis]|uniref:Yip1 domain-containing protein n=1 Tax=Candidatus Halobonum tyrrellensis G22 TaxID=1324957 RepID=V4HBY4_9EURY|nr:hypothetical protein [Candidatus Halobonum tyrrellensis]ESP88215.1 hypothetical protein K933_10125 [Candidatus Halobonum tyrrellensis G22]